MVWCGVRYVIWSGADWFGGVCYVYGLVWPGLEQSVMVMVWHNLVWCKVAMVYSSLVCGGEDLATYGNGGGVREK